MDELVRALRTPGFGRLVGSYWLNELTDWLSTIALSVLVYDATRDPLATTALFVASKFAPGFVVPALAARLDGLPTARLLAVLYVLDAVALGALGLMSAAFWLPGILVLAFAAGTCASVARVIVRAASVAVLEAQDRLREGNAVLNIGYSAMNAASPLVAGALVAAAGAGPVLAAGAVVFVAMALVAGTARGLPAGTVHEDGWSTRLREGLAYLRTDHRLRALIGGQALVALLLLLITPIEVVYAKETLGTGDAGFGVLLASWGVGMVLGSWAFARERRRSLMLLIGIGTLAMSAGYLGMAVAPGLAVACVASTLGGLGNGVQWVAVYTAIQESTAERFQARIAGVMEAALTIAPGIGFLIGGGLTALLSPRAAFAVSGGGILIIFVVGVVALNGGRARLGSVPPAEPAPEPAG